jgi:hypothetical protein
MHAVKRAIVVQCVMSLKYPQPKGVFLSGSNQKVPEMSFEYLRPEPSIAPRV